MNVLQSGVDPSTAKKRPSQMHLSPQGPAGKQRTPGGTKQASKTGNDDLGTFLTMTDVKPMAPNTISKSPEVRKSSMNIFNPNKSVDNVNTQSPLSQSARASPGSQSMMMSFNFITSVPIDEFVQVENSKASKAQDRLRSRASLKIEDELKRKLKEKAQREKLYKAIKTNTDFLKKRVDNTKEKEKEKFEAVRETQKNFRKLARKKQLETEKKMAEDDNLRKTKIQEASGARLQEIKRYMEVMREKQSKVRDFQ